MPNEQFTLLEATPQTIANLNRLKSISPHLNLGATEMSNGNNSGIVANPPSAGNAVITGPFDVRMTYLEEDDGQGNMEMVPYVQVFDSSLQNATYAGYVYYQNQILNVMPGVLAPSQGWLYLEIDLINNTATFNIANTVPTYSLQWKKWAYALAYISVSNNVYSIRRVHLPGNIVMPSFQEGYKGYFALSARIAPVEGGDPKYYIDCSGGYCLVNGVMRLVSNASFETTSSNTHKYIVLHYTQQIANNGGVESYSLTLELWNSMSGTSLNASDTDSYCLIGAFERVLNSIDIIQQSHGIPVMFTFTSDC